MRTFNSIGEAIKDIRNGKMVIVTDAHDRENEGDLIMAAEKATPEAINFMIRHGGGLICMPITESLQSKLGLDMMVEKNTETKKTAFTISVDYNETSTGISAFERCLTIQKMIDPDSISSDFTRPGHIFPLVARENGVLARGGHTEAAVDLVKLAGLFPAGVICEILKEDGTMAREDDLVEYSKKYGLKMITIEDLIAYRRNTEKTIVRQADAKMPTRFGNFRILGYIDKITGEHHLALVKGVVDDGNPVMVRIHSECLTGDVFGSQRCDCGEQLEEAMVRINAAGRGVLIYLRQEGRGIGLINKLKAYELQEEGLDTVEANLALGFKPDMRDFHIGAEILSDLGISKVDLLTNNPMKIKGLTDAGIEIMSRVPIQMNHNEKNLKYLKTKRLKLGHWLNF